MSETVIKTENIGKRYRLGQRGASYATLRDALTNLFKFGNPRSAKDKKKDDHHIWALKDVSFEVKRGDVVGIIGKNGAGKSTLLKIFSRITEPTEGRITMSGRVGSLLEVGTGFHPELTGRENIFLNGAILGMSKKEIERKFDTIVAFAELEKFIDTPVKFYSSGMYVRLAFAVAANMESDILIIDEVLAVGDVQFQKKCLGQMEAVGKEGRTVLFVSHNMGFISSLCQKAIVLDQGQIKYEGNVDEAVRQYNDTLFSQGTQWQGDEGDENVRLLHTWVKSLDPNGQFHTDADIEIGIEVDILKEMDGLIFGFRIFSCYGYELAYVLYDDTLEEIKSTIVKPGKMVKRFIIPANTFSEGSYRIGFSVGIHMLKTIILNTSGSLEFELDNVSGIGRRFLINRVRGFTSLFRPNWEVS